MTWTAHYFVPQLNRDAATRGFGSKDDALTAACDLIRRRCLVHFVQGPNEKIGADAISPGGVRAGVAAVGLDPDLLLGRIVLARRPSDVLDNLLSRFLQWSGLLSHLRSYERYDEPETLPYTESH